MLKKTVTAVIAILMVYGLVTLAFINYTPSGETVATKTTSQISASSLPDVVATVNGVAITSKELAGSINSRVSQMAMMGRQIGKEDIVKLQGAALENLIIAEALYQDAVARGVMVDEKQLANESAMLETRYNEDAAFRDSLKEQGVTISGIKEKLKRHQLIKKLVTQSVSNVEITETEAFEFYQENEKMFNMPEMVRARHILIKVAPDAAEEEMAIAEKKINDIAAKREAGEDFAELAKKYSEGPTGANGGDLGFFPKGAMVPEFDEAAFSMAPGSKGKVVQTRFGLHYIETVESKASGKAEFHEVKDTIISRLKGQQSEKMFKEFLQAVKGKAEVKRYL